MLKYLLFKISNTEILSKSRNCEIYIVNFTLLHFALFFFFFIKET